MKRLILTMMTVGVLALTANSSIEAMQFTETQTEMERWSADREKVLTAIVDNDIAEIANLINQGVEMDEGMLVLALECFTFFKEENMQEDIALTADTINFLLNNGVHADAISLVYTIINKLAELLPTILQSMDGNRRNELLGDTELLWNPGVYSLVRDKNYFNFTAIQMAVEEESVDMLEILINNGAALTRDAILYSVQNNLAIARFLLDTMDEESLNNIVFHCEHYSELPIQLAAERGMESLNFMIDFYREVFPNISLHDIVTNIPENGNSLLIYSTQTGNYEVTEFLLQNGAKEVIDLPNWQRYTPVNNAVRMGRADLLTLLFNYGATMTSDALAYLGILEEEEEEFEEEEYSLRETPVNN